MTWPTEAGDHFYMVSLKIVPGPAYPESLQGIKTRLEEARDMVVHKFKVIGEPQVLAVFQLPNSGLADFDACIGRFAEIEGVVIESKLLARYEKFARETLGVQADLTKRDSDNYIAGLSPILWCEYTVKYNGRSVETLREAWKKEATLGLEGRHQGFNMEVYKVVSETKVHFFISMTMTAEEWDIHALKVPLNEEDIGSLVGVAKYVQILDS